ncbi:hypothetical protein CPAR01_07777 [Colletotrichum paranaense]|uniref:Secreted protein n=1 Tax=Colletotrichum paranaense TaxID=1914294 RepID=A0ABQ9SID1_9PEZI|nr:uncharacterized protein CPAR01_07777 [Colletotrichum paranaense]KAK1537664.1 hypothetical protein CPAR01_07777 [Colletotrichum paranaense]
MSTPTLCIAPALQVAAPGLAIFFLDAPAQHIYFRSHFRPFSPTPSSVTSRYSLFPVHSVLSLLRPLPCPSTRPAVQFLSTLHLPFPFPHLYPHFPLHIVSSPRTPASLLHLILMTRILS